MWEREQSESGWRLWIADVVLWGFGSGRARLNPSLAGWHQGEEEVTAPQHNTQPIKQRVARARKERKAHADQGCSKGRPARQALASHTPKHPASFEADYQKKLWVNSKQDAAKT